MGEFVGPTILLGKYIVGPIKRQFNYLCCFNANIQKLEEEAKRLDDSKQGLKLQVEEATRNAQPVLTEVESWQHTADTLQQNYVTEIEAQIQNVKSGCLAIKSRYSLSRKALKMIEDMKKLQDDNRFTQIAVRALPACMAPIAPVQFHEFESRKLVEEDIMATLREKNKKSMIGIYGMGGVGKTTMAKKIMSRARGEGLFDEIVMVVVSQPVDMLRIQKEIAEWLGLKFDFESLSVRAHSLRSRLINTKSILIILDDLWERFNLEDLGIPDQRELKECTILLTSRDRDVFTEMNVEEIFQIKILSENEGWHLFKEKVGARVAREFFPKAREIVSECKGLPIALATISMALKDKANISIWENAVHELRICNPQHIPGFIAQVYTPLKLSYDLLEDEDVKSIFLLCCLFPEDHNIGISKLCMYAWGLGIFEGITSLHVARNIMQVLVETLKSRSLLMDSKYEGYVKMHDVIRDVGIFIAVKRGLMDPNLSWKSQPTQVNNCSNINCSWISLFPIHDTTVSIGFVSPDLRFLLIRASHSWGSPIPELVLSDNFFKSARELLVLSITNCTLRSLPNTVQLVRNLRSLILMGCLCLEDISVVAELVCLEILYCVDCDSIKELPGHLGRLNQLKLLHISWCENLRRVERGVISRLDKLEELTLIGSFSEWEWEGSEGKNATLCELNSLSKLTTLEIEIEDASLAAEHIHLPNLVQFNMSVGVKWSSLKYGKALSLVLERDCIIGDWIHRLLNTTEQLYLEGEGSSKLIPLLPHLHNLKKLWVESTKMTRLSDGTNITVFPLLEYLHLKNIQDLEEIHNGPISSRSYKNLQGISLIGLPKLHLWNDEENSGSSHIHHLPKLEKLTLRDLPKLVSFCKGIDNKEFPALTRLEVANCPNLKCVVCSSNEEGYWDDGSLHLFCKSYQGVFSRLEGLVISSERRRLWCRQFSIDFFTQLMELTICDSNYIKSLFPPSIARNLVNLKRFTIKSCSMLEQVVLWSGEESGNNIDGETSHNYSRITFPKLKYLFVDNLPRLTSFCKGIQSIEFPALTQLEIVSCPNMKSVVPEHICGSINHDSDDSLHLFCKSQVVFGDLKTLVIDGYKKQLNLWCDQISIDFFISIGRLEIRKCNNITSLFSILMAKNLINLGYLSVESCHEIVKLIEGEGIERSMFVKLEYMCLKDLPKLKAFCDWRCTLHLPLVRKIDIERCSEMERFTFGSLITPNLDRIKTNGERITRNKDLNNIVS